MSEADPTLPRYGTDPVQRWFLNFAAKPIGPLKVKGEG